MVTSTFCCRFFWTLLTQWLSYNSEQPRCVPQTYLHVLLLQSQLFHLGCVFNSRQLSKSANHGSPPSPQAPRCEIKSPSCLTVYQMQLHQICLCLCSSQVFFLPQYQDFPKGYVFFFSQTLYKGHCQWTKRKWNEWFKSWKSMKHTWICKISITFWYRNIKLHPLLSNTISFDGYIDNI